MFGGNFVLKHKGAPNPIFSIFFQTSGDFGITRNIANFAAGKHSIWKILINENEPGYW